METNQIESKSESTLHNPQVGELVRYGTGATALMFIHTLVDGEVVGLQCMGGCVSTREVIHIPSFRDRRMWVQCAQWRRQTMDEAAAQIGYVLGEDDPNDAAQPLPGQHVAELENVPDAIHARVFVDTPDAKPIDPKVVTMPRDEWDAHHKEINFFLALCIGGAFLIGVVIGFAIRSVV